MNPKLKILRMRKYKERLVMGELFMKYPIGEFVEYEGNQYRILGYEIYSDKQYLVCMKGDIEYRIEAEK